MFLHPAQDGVSSGQSATAAADGAAAFSGILGIPPTCPRRCRGRQLNQACVSFSGHAVLTCRAVCDCSDWMCRCSDPGLCPHIHSPVPSTLLQLFLYGLAFCTRLFVFFIRSLGSPNVAEIRKGFWENATFMFEGNGVFMQLCLRKQQQIDGRHQNSK